MNNKERILPFIRISNWDDFISTFSDKRVRGFVFDNLRKRVSEIPLNSISTDSLWVPYDEEGEAEFSFIDFKCGAYHFEYITTIK